MKDGWYFVILDGVKVVASTFNVNGNQHWHFGEDAIIEDKRITAILDFVGDLGLDVDQQFRPEGYYWCYINSVSDGEVAFWWKGKWNRIGFTREYDDSVWYKIGIKIQQP